jgi:outer membrane protein assembly factor BamA
MPDINSTRKIFRFLISAFIAGLCTFGAIPLKAQTDTARSVPDSSAAVPQKDVGDIIKRIFHKPKPAVPGEYVKPDSSRKIYYSLLPGLGYALQTGFTLAFTTNVAFYTGKRSTTNLSSITAIALYSQYKQFFTPIISNIWLPGNNFGFSGDWRYYHYPSLTFGLGGHTSLSNPDHLDYSYFRFYETAFRKIKGNFFGGIGYNLDYHWNIHDLDAEKGANTDFQKYEGSVPGRSVSSGISLNLLYDTRKNPNNPEPGHYFNAVYTPHLQALGSDRNWQSLLLDFRKYIRLPFDSKNTLAFWNMYWLTLSGKPPYLDLPGTGWDTYNNMGRGYIQGRIKGNNLLYLETEYRFRISQNGLFGGVVFANIETVSNWPQSSSPDFDKLYPAAGLGIRLKANKLSNTNFSIDYAVGIGGSKGFMLNLGEAF